MSLDLRLRSAETKKVACSCRDCDNIHTVETYDWHFSTNITHNLGRMFAAAGVYEILWRGDGLIAGEQLPKLEQALADMKQNKAKFEALDSENGWGLYVHAVPWLEEVVQAFKANPEAVLECSR